MDDLTKMINERMAARAASAAQGKTSNITQHEAVETPTEDTEVTSVDTPVVESVATEQQVAPVTPPTPDTPTTPTPSPLRDVLTKANLSVENLTDDELSASLAKSLAERDAERRRIAELEAELQQIRQQAQVPVQQPLQQPQVPVTSAEQKEQIKRWQRVDIDQNLVRFCEYDEKTEKFLPDPKYGVDGQNAAKQLNDAVVEQRRRTQLIVNDPYAAMQEAGVLDSIEQKMEERLTAWQENLVRKLSERQQQQLQQRQQQQVENEVQSFYEQHKAELFKCGPDGQPMFDLTGNQVPTERGKLFSQKFNEIRQEMGDSIGYHQAIKLAYKMLPPAEEAKPAVAPPATPQAKKQEFIEKARSKPEARKPSPIAEALVQPAETGRKLSFREMLVRDPDNAELLGTHYQGT